LSTTAGTSTPVQRHRSQPVQSPTRHPRRGLRPQALDRAGASRTVHRLLCAGRRPDLDDACGQGRGEGAWARRQRAPVRHALSGHAHRPADRRSEPGGSRRQLGPDPRRHPKLPKLGSPRRSSTSPSSPTSTISSHIWAIWTGSAQSSRPPSPSERRTPGRRMNRNRQAPDVRMDVQPVDADTPPKRVFLSYSRQQFYFAESLAAHLQRRGVDVCSTSAVAAGENWSDRVADGLRASEVLLSSGATPHSRRPTWRRMAHRAGRRQAGSGRPCPDGQSASGPGGVGPGHRLPRTFQTRT